MLAARDDNRRHQHIRLVVGLGLEIGNDREFAQVEFMVAHQRLETGIGDLDVGEFELDQIGRHGALFDRQRIWVIAQKSEEFRFRCHGRILSLI